MFVLVMALATAAVVLLPTSIELSESSRRSLTYAELSESQLASLGEFLKGVFVPQPVPPTLETIQLMPFAGTATAVLAIVGFCVRRRHGTWLGRSLIVVTLLVAVGTPITWIAFQIPGMDVFRPYSRLSGWFAFGIALLAGIGLDAVIRWFRQRHVAQTLWRQRLVMIGACVCVALVGVELADYGRRANPAFAPREAAFLYPPRPLIRVLEAHRYRPSGWPERYVPIRRRETGDGDQYFAPTLTAAQALVFGFDSGSGYDSTLPRRTANLMRVLTGEPINGVLANGLSEAYIPHFESGTTRYDLLDRLGFTMMVATPDLPPEERWGPQSRRALAAELLYSGSDGSVFALEGNLGGPWIVSDVVVVDSEEEAIRQFTRPAFPYRKQVVLEREEITRLPASARPTDPAGVAAVLGAAKGVNGIRVETETSAPAWLVVPDNWDPGWSATVNGESTPVLRGNYNQTVIALPSGESVVWLEYRPQGLIAGMAISGSAALVLLLIGVLPFVRRDPRPTPVGRPHLEDELIRKEIRPDGETNRVADSDDR
jgi:hypothetical protein